MRLPVAAVMAVWFGVGCTSEGPLECTLDSQCLQGRISGHCIAGSLAAETKAYCAFPDPNCPGGLRWGVLAGEQSTMCVSPDLLDAGVPDARAADGGADATRSPAFDIAYPDQWKFSINDQIDGFLQIINTSDRSMSTATLAVKSMTDDHPTGSIVIVAAPSSMTIFPGEAGGELSGASEQLFASLVTEPRTDLTSDYLSMRLVDFPAGTYDIEATLVITLEGRDVSMPMTIHHLPGNPGVYADPIRGKRISVTR
jgi:hypothetical protein